MIVDCYALAGRGQTWGTEPERDVDYDVTEFFDRAAEAGIDRHCILAARNTTYEIANRHIARLCERHSKKLIGFAVHNPKTEAGRIRRMLAEEVRSMGLCGVRSDGHPTRELMDAAAELRIPVVYYPRIGAGQTAGRYYHTLAATYPNVDVILPHLGQYRSWAWWGHIEAIDLARRYPNVYVNSAGIGSFKYLEMAARELPPEKILFGSCTPELDPRVEMEAIRLLKLPKESFAKVTGGNILRLLRKRTA